MDAIAPALGSTLTTHDPIVVDGTEVMATISPPDIRALGSAMRHLGENRLSALPRGAGTQLGLGNVPARADCFLSMDAFDEIDELDAAEGVCHAGAGVRLSDLRARVAEAGWELPLDDAGRGGTLGGALATASLAPRALGFGRPRDVVLGCEVVLADGTRSRCGGRVVKNVTGYDMAKLYTGSLGSVGVITGAWIRLQPRPDATRVLERTEVEDAEACRIGVDAARRVSARSVLLAGETHGLRPVVELAGDEASVERDAEELVAMGLREAIPSVRDAVAARRFAGLPNTMRFLVSFLPTQIDACVAALREAEADLLVLPGLNLVCARFPAAEADACFEATALAARQGRGRVLCEQAPAAAKSGRDVFGASEGDMLLTGALKARFDLLGVLNPGRFAGGV